MNPKDWPRLIITLAILGAFLGALAFRYSPGLEETLKAVVMLAIGYWLGSSKGSSDKSSQLEEMQAAPRRVTIDQPANDPIPVDQTGEKP